MSEVFFDISQLRFGISPIWETVTSVWALNNPRRHARHLPWIEPVRELARDAKVADHLDWIRAFARPRAWLPDFLTPPPLKPISTIEDDLERLLATPLELVVTDIEMIANTAPPLPGHVQTILEDPEAGLKRVADAIHGWWRTAMAAPWPRIQALLEADIGFRTQDLVEGGARLLFHRLHQSTEWTGDRLRIEDGFEVNLVTEGRGLTLNPSIFADRQVMVSLRDEVLLTGIYPARAVGTLWETKTTSKSQALHRLVGDTRARLMLMLSAPVTGGALATRLGMSAATTSQQLAILHHAGMVARRRHGKHVYHQLTEAGFALLDATRALG